MVREFTKKIVNTVLRRKTASSEKPKTPEEKIAQMSEKELRQKCLNQQAQVHSLNDGLAESRADTQALTEKIEEMTGELEITRDRSLKSFEQVFGEDDQEIEHLANFTAQLENMVKKGTLSRDEGRKILVDARYCLTAAEQWPKFRRTANAWNRQATRLERSLAKEKNDLIKAKRELDTLRYAEKLNEVLDWTMELINDKPGLLKVSEASMMFLNAEGGADASASQMSTLRKAAVFAIISDLLTTQKSFFKDLASEQRKAKDVDAKYSRLLEQLRIINPTEIAELEARLKEAERLKDEEEKGGERNVSEPFEDIMKDIIPKAVASRTVLQDICTALVSYFPEEKETIVKLVTGVEHLVDADAKVSEYIKHKLVSQKSALTRLKDTSTTLYDAVQQLFPEATAEDASDSYQQDRKRLAEIINSDEIPAVKNEKLAVFVAERLAASYAVEDAVERIAENKETLYDIAVLAKGEDVDKDRFNENPASYVVIVLGQMRAKLVAAVTDYSILSADPITLVKKAGVHKLLGNAHAAKGDEANADVQYRKAQGLYAAAREITPENRKDSIEAEIAKFEKPDKEAEE